MANNEFYNDIENRIKESLADGLNTGNFDKLNAAISDSVKGVISEASGQVASSIKAAGVDTRESLKNAYKTYSGQKPYNNREETQAYAEMLKARRQAHNEAVKAKEAQERRLREERRNQSREADTQIVYKDGTNIPVKFEPIGGTSGAVCIGVGVAGLALSVWNLVVNLVKVAFGAPVTSIVLGGILAIAFIILINVGVSQRSFLTRAKRYAKVCGQNMYAEISSLASAMGYTTAKVKRDLKKMLRKGFFPEGYLDAEETTLMLSSEVYKQYQLTKQYSAQAVEAANKNEIDDLPEDLDPSVRAELSCMITDGRGYIQRLHALNEMIPGEKITEKLTRLEDLLTEIFDRVKEHPEQMSRMHKLMEYYLPTMIKLVEAYEEYDKVSAPGEEIVTAKNEIENTLDTINEAFVQLLNNLFQDSIWDVTSDAQVLNTMLKQAGLASDIKSDEI